MNNETVISEAVAEAAMKCAGAFAARQSLGVSLHCTEKYITEAINASTARLREQVDNLTELSVATMNIAEEPREFWEKSTVSCPTIEAVKTLRNERDQLQSALQTSRELCEEIRKERDDLLGWKSSMLKYCEQWDKTDSFVRNHPDALVGANVAVLTRVWLKERDTLRQQLAVLEQERSDLSNHVLITFERHDDLLTAEQQRDKLKQQNKELLRALKTVLASAHPHPMENGQMYAAWETAKAAINAAQGKDQPA